MKYLHHIFLLFFLACSSPKPSHDVKNTLPENGTYTYRIAYAEWGGIDRGFTCLVRIKHDSVFIIQNETTVPAGNKGDVIDKGVIRRHLKTGKWIIAHTPDDVHAEYIGGCQGGPAMIDFLKKEVWMC